MRRKRASGHVALQAGVAGDLGSVAAAQVDTHDALIRMWGDRRLGDISWSIYGPVEAASYALGAWKEATPKAVNGTLEEGWEKVSALTGEGHNAQSGEYVESMKAFAALQPEPVLVLAFCDVRPPR